MDINIFENGWGRQNAYIFGIIMSDGCLLKEGRNKNRYAVRIVSNDFDMIKTLHDIMCIGNKIYKYKKSYTIKYRNEESIIFMMENKLTERKSLTLEFPDIPDDFIPDFIRGFFDGDGSIILHKNTHNLYAQVTFTCASYNFLLSLQEVLKINSIKSKIYDGGHKDSKALSLRITDRDSINAFERFIYNEPCIFLDRKYQKFITLNSYPKKYKSRKSQSNV